MIVMLWLVRGLGGSTRIANGVGSGVGVGRGVGLGVGGGVG
jgi:hypothetical protein